MIKHFNNKYKVNLINTLYFICGFVVFSPIASYISLNILKLPFAVPELLFVPFYFIFKKTIDLKPNYKTLAIGSSILLFLMAVAFIVNLFPFSSILSTARGYFYMIVVFSIFKNKPLQNIDFIFFITFGASVAWIMLGLASFNQRLLLGSYDETLAVYGNMIALGLFIAISILYKRTIFQLFSILIVTTLSLTVGLRRQILISLVSYVLSFIIKVNFTLKSTLKNLSIVFVIVFISINAYPVLKNYMEIASPILYVRIFLKSEQFLSNELGESDQHRLNSFKNFNNNIEDYILPRGLVSKRSTKDTGTGIYMDSPYTEIFHTFGIILTIPLIIFLIKSILFHFRSYYILKNKESSLWLIMIGVVITLLFIEGSFLNFVYATPITGFVFARIASRRSLIA